MREDGYIIESDSIFRGFRSEKKKKKKNSWQFKAQARMATLRSVYFCDFLTLVVLDLDISLFIFRVNPPM